LTPSEREIERAWNEAVVAWFKVLPRHLLDVTEKNYKMCRYIRSQKRDFNSRRHETQVVLLFMSFPVHLCIDLSPAMRVAGQILTSLTSILKTFSCSRSQDCLYICKSEFF
jgi:hypothetical protein